MSEVSLRLPGEPETLTRTTLADASGHHPTKMAMMKIPEFCELSVKNLTLPSANMMFSVSESAYCTIPVSTSGN